MSINGGLGEVAIEEHPDDDPETTPLLFLALESSVNSLCCNIDGALGCCVKADPLLADNPPPETKPSVLAPSRSWECCRSWRRCEGDRFVAQIGGVPVRGNVEAPDGVREESDGPKMAPVTLCCRIS